MVSCVYKHAECHVVHVLGKKKLWRIHMEEVCVKSTFL
jgi:hypothetical protein